MEVSTAFLSIALTPHVFVGAAYQSDVDQTPAHVFSKFMLILTTQCVNLDYPVSIHFQLTGKRGWFEPIGESNRTKYLTISGFQLTHELVKFFYRRIRIMEFSFNLHQKRFLMHWWSNNKDQSL